MSESTKMLLVYFASIAALILWFSCLAVSTARTIITYWFMEKENYEKRISEALTDKSFSNRAQVH